MYFYVNKFGRKQLIPSSEDRSQSLIHSFTDMIYEALPNLVLEKIFDLKPSEIWSNLCFKLTADTLITLLIGFYTTDR